MPVTEMRYIVFESYFILVEMMPCFPFYPRQYSGRYLLNFEFGLKTKHNKNLKSESECANS